MSGLVLDWQKKLGYSKDPFTQEIPTPISKHLVGTADLQEKVNLFLIKDDRFGTVSGDRGTGKTMFLRWINDELAPQKSHCQQLLDAKETSKSEDIITTLLTTRLSFIEKRFGKVLRAPIAEQEKLLLQRLAKEQKNVLLIDNAGHLGKHELELLSRIITSTPTHVIIADTEERLKKLGVPEGITDKLKLHLPNPTSEQLADMMRRRIESVGGFGTYPFNKDELDGIIKKSEKSPTKLLQIARERAIELSLKVQEIPRPVQTQQRSNATTATPSASSAPTNEPVKKSFFGITVEKRPAQTTTETSTSAQRQAERTAPQKDEELEDASDVPDIPLSETTAHDAEALSDIINASSNPSKPEIKQESTIKKTAFAPQEEKLSVKINNPHETDHHRTKHDKVVENLAREFEHGKEHKTSSKKHTVKKKSKK